MRALKKCACSLSGAKHNLQRECYHWDKPVFEHAPVSGLTRRVFIAIYAPASSGRDRNRLVSARESKKIARQIVKKTASWDGTLEKLEDFRIRTGGRRRDRLRGSVHCFANSSTRWSCFGFQSLLGSEIRSSDLEPDTRDKRIEAEGLPSKPCSSQ